MRPVTVMVMQHYYYLHRIAASGVSITRSGVAYSTGAASQVHCTPQAQAGGVSFIIFSALSSVV